MAGTRWLDDEEQKTWRSFLDATRLLWDRLEAQLQRDAGMPASYYQVLVHLSEAPGRALRMSDLAVATTSSRSRLSHAVARLEAAGWVERRACPTDRRGQVAVLTDQGMAALEAAAPGHVTAVRESLFDALSPEQVRQLGQIASQVVDGLRQACAEAASACEEAAGAFDEAAGAFDEAAGTCEVADQKSVRSAGASPLRSS